MKYLTNLVRRCICRFWLAAEIGGTGSERNIVNKLSSRFM